MTHRRAVLGLVVVALVWGASFSIIKAALEHSSPLLFLGIRFSLAALVLVGSLRGISRKELSAGAVLGLLFWGGFVFQTTGLAYTTPSRSAFITSLSTPLVPVIFFLVTRIRPRWQTVAGVALACAGLYLLTRPGDSGGGLNRGDLLTLACAVLFAGQIVAVGHFSRAGAAVRLLAVELGVTAVLSLAAALLLETPRLEPTYGLAGAFAFLSLSAVATFWFQLRAQRVVSPAQTALVFALGPVAAAVTSYVAFGETLSLTQWIGGGLILAGMVVPEFGRVVEALPPAGAPAG
jgi:drug/metabolite transporter (DMT)-like permease